MLVQLVIGAILLPFILVFIYAGVHEYKRYKSEGRATYGLVYDEKTGTTHVGGLADESESFKPTEFDPGGYNDAESTTKADNDKA
ncbi:MAG: hypothetical protein GVY34_02770 [Alphaproteobacteria bacterium]|jgi:hypothetical protein|nr:hypothetical protein [Alphaproteobacteria bacterium]